MSDVVLTRTDARVILNPTTGGVTLEPTTTEIRLASVVNINGRAPTRFDTEVELLAADLEDGTIAYAFDTDEFWYRADGAWGPGGAPLSDNAPAAVGTASAGVSGESSRSDHVHAHGNQLGGALHAVATGSTAGFMSASDKSFLDTISGGAYVVSFNGRQGVVAPATNDYTWAQINKATSSIADITTKTHALLSSLGADDHTQYLLLAGRAAACQFITKQVSARASGGPATSEAWGEGAIASADYATALGYGAHAYGAAAVAVGGLNTAALTTDSIAIGDAATVNTGAYGALAIGPNTTIAVDATYAVAIGKSANASKNDATAVGHSSNAAGSPSAAFGAGAVATANNSTAIGPSASATGGEGVAVGGNSVSVDGSVVVGAESHAHSGSVMVGPTARSEVGISEAVGVGYSVSCAAAYGVAVGSRATTDAYGYGAIAVGNFAAGNGLSGIAIGQSAQSLRGGSTGKNIAIGPSAVAGDIAGASNIAIGDTAKAGDTGSSSEIAIGGLAISRGGTGIAIGLGASSIASNGAIAIGNGASVPSGSLGAVVIGASASAQASSGVVGVAIGSGATIQGSGKSVAIGDGSTAPLNCVAVGGSIGAPSPGECVVVGIAASCTFSSGGAYYGVAIGYGAVASNGANNATLVGHSVTVAAVGGTAIGSGASVGASATYSVAIGLNATVTGDSCVAIGTGASASATSTVAIGYSANPGAGHDCVLIGRSTGNTGGRHRMVIIGSQASVSGGASDDNVLVGYSSSSSATAAIGIGSGVVANGQRCLVIGQGLTVSATNGVFIGTTDGAARTLSSTNGIVIGGPDADVSGASVTAIGSTLTLGTAANVTAFGHLATANAAGVVVLGKGAIASGANSIAIGLAATTSTFTNALAIGASATCVANNDAQLGTSSQPLNLSIYGTTRMVSGAAINWSSSSTIPTSTADAGIARATAGIVKATDGASALGLFRADGIQLLTTDLALTVQNSGGTQTYLAMTSGQITNHSSGWELRWTDGATTSSTRDTGLLRDSAATMRVTNGATGIGAIKSDAVVLAKTTDYPVVINDGSTLFTNEGAGAQVTFSLPTAVAGHRYSFYVQVAQTLKVLANAGDTIRLAGNVSAAAGYVDGNTVGSSIELVAINATEWVATTITGTWNNPT